MNTRYRSFAEWPKDALVGNVTTQDHATKIHAEKVCQNLMKNGVVMLEGWKLFPVRTWVEPIAKEESHG